MTWPLSIQVTALLDAPLFLFSVAFPIGTYIRFRIMKARYDDLSFEGAVADLFAERMRNALTIAYGLGFAAFMLGVLTYSLALTYQPIDTLIR